MEGGIYGMGVIENHDVSFLDECFTLGIKFSVVSGGGVNRVLAL